MVLVSNLYRFIFLKTGKTAGTSVEMALEPACAPKGHEVQEQVATVISKTGIVGSRLLPCTLPPQPALERGTWCNHKSAAHIRRDLGEMRFNSYTKITTVRNPFDQCVSAFHWQHRRLIDLIDSFAQLRSAFQAYIKARDWVTNKPIVFIDGTYIIDRAIRFEHLHEDLSAVANDLGIPLQPAGLPHTKSTSNTRKSYLLADYYDQTCIDIVRERLAWVFEHFDYPDHPQFIEQGQS